MLTALPRVDWLGSLNSLKKLDFATLRRSAAWASAAFIAVVAMIFAAGSETGSQRLQQAFSGSEPARATPVVAQIPAPQPELERLARQLNDTVKSLTAERDKLNDRLASLERNFDDVTGATKQPAGASVAPKVSPLAAPTPPAPAVPPMTIFTAVPPLPMDSPAVWPATRPATTASSEAVAPAATHSSATPADAGPQIAAPETVTPAMTPATTTSSMTSIMTPTGVTASGQSSVPLPPSRFGRDATGSTTGFIAEPDSEQARAQQHAEARGANQILGVDLGGARSIDALTIHWSALKVKFGAQLDNLQPVVSIRERKPGVPELRLIAGPIAGAEAATKLCMILVTARATCRPTQFSGQRLSQR